MSSPGPALYSGQRDAVGDTPPRAGITIFGCDPTEAALFGEIAVRFGVRVTITNQEPSEATVDLALGNRSISVGHKTRLGGPLLRSLCDVGVRRLSTRSVGDDHIDRRQAAELGMVVETVPYSPDSVADYTLMLILMVLRGAKSTLQNMRIGDYRPSPVRGTELQDLTVGVIGTGRIGSAVVHRLRGFGCRVLTHDRRSDAATAVPLVELLRQSDVVSLHVPLNSGTHHLLDGGRIEQMRPGACVVNTGRGALVETEALLTALESGQLGGAALDVLEGEEASFYRDCRDGVVQTPWLTRLEQLPNVLITPHVAYYTEHALRDVVENTLLGCVTFEECSL